MMWGYGQNMWWMWLWGMLLLVGIAVLVLLAIRVFGAPGRGVPPGQGHAGAYGTPASFGAGPGGPGGPGGRSQARLILDERFARGELTAEQYREHVKELGEGP
ncbi:SHOCT domain-containing protein [Arthrobacter sp. UKPF54-2]|uniref:SHOCT domain-containing protein n=1 Tax=Arthrobacter sp. UKPF54-2 TaxID=2600159 RepID=UPI0011B192AD|nr:SHOCT domain-containing protein [Arthrobacter sp. UKPF54-2]QDY89566.1 SHOCT domain-containing protein [Arthrobacter sp. UKPF54-2]